MAAARSRRVELHWGYLMHGPNIMHSLETRLKSEHSKGSSLFFSVFPGKCLDNILNFVDYDHFLPHPLQLLIR